MIARWSNGVDSIEASGDAEFVAWAHKEFHAFREDMAKRQAKHYELLRRESLNAELVRLCAEINKAKSRIREIDFMLRIPA